MGQWLADMGTFLVQLVAVGAVVAVVALLIGRSRRGDVSVGDRLRIMDLGRLLEQRKQRLSLALHGAKARRALLKRFKRDTKKADAKSEEGKVTHWVLDFHGNIKASGVERLAQEVSALLLVVKEGDEVVLRLESPGGLVHAYGQAAAELDRLRQAGVRLTVCVDKVAASGGYLMACNADQIRVAPFSVIGSIGVVAQVPNLHRLLKRHDVDVELHTAGRFKRTLTVLGENTEEGREKFQEDLEATHEKFKGYVAERRPAVDIEAVATGEIWYGQEAVDMGLADVVGTSEAYLMEAAEQGRVLSVRLEPKRGLGARFGFGISHLVEQVWERVEERLEASRWERR
uniref:protease SohB n=1 Tax=Halomonas sp. TaxID=1486246 RepID=UPI002635B208|nr:protease SohB [Halomonas sp.]